MLFYNNENIKIYNDSCLTIDDIESESIDLCITSPPYNVKLKYNSYEDTLDYDTYLSFTDDWLTNVYKWLKPDGRICINVPLTHSKDEIKQPLGSDIIQICKQIGYGYRTTIIWNKNNISSPFARGTFLSAQSPQVIPHIEIIIVMYKKQWRKINEGKSTISKDDFLDWTNGIWNITGNNNPYKHFATFPLELPKRLIQLFSYETDTVLDCFSGSGTSLIACMLNNRKGIGIEIDKDYCKLSKENLTRYDITI
jgi:site-specific DNA-methyltransferase (adenine-specific)